ncbi:MAG: hypothetical protein JWM68_3004 [Verrucomicrobiales bacterium]|nr:hypothetical protein [Verrucomicrobiales bacterium]
MRSSKFDEFDLYSENLLLAQHDVSEIISHELMKGEVREDFLISVLASCSEPPPILVRGTLSDGKKDAGQLDIILCRPHAQLRKMGSQCYVEKSDSLCVIEVKGNCTGRDLNRAEAKAQVIQKLKGKEKPLYGVVCYKSKLTEATIMKRFGFAYEANTETYFDPATAPKSKKSQWPKIIYPNLDFFMSFEEDKKIFVRKYALTPGTFRFARVMNNPLIKDLFSMVKSLWKTAHH